MEAISRYDAVYRRVYGGEGDTLVKFEKVEFVKRFLRLPLRLRSLSHLRAVKRSVLLFGNSICCPACTYNKELLGDRF